jgi:hypothetical protein
MHRIPASLRRPLRGCALVGAVGSVATIIGAVLQPRQALYSYLFAYAYVLSIALGALVLVLMANAGGVRWFLVFRRSAEAVAGMLLALAPLLLPILIGMRALYPWTDLGSFTDAHARHLVEHKQAWLSPGAFVVRSILYFAVFLVAYLLLSGWSRRQDHDPDPALVGNQRAFSAVMLPAVALALTFGAFDWFMSLTPTWQSSIYGIYFWAGGFVAAIAILVLLGVRLEGPRPPHFHALGRLMLAFTVFWAYIAYAQGFITWIANKPDEVTWYLPRIHGSWGGVGIFLIFAQFAIPFFALLSRGLKHRPRRLARVAALVLCAHVFDSYWMILPVLHPQGIVPHWLDLAALLAVAGLCSSAAILLASRQQALPAKAPNLELALRYKSL